MVLSSCSGHVNFKCIFPSTCHVQRLLVQATMDTIQEATENIEVELQNFGKI